MGLYYYCFKIVISYHKGMLQFAAYSMIVSFTRLSKRELQGALQ
jgi:hypothetical protein